MRTNEQVTSDLGNRGHSGRTEFLGVEFDTIGLDRLVAQLAAARADGSFSYVVTPNVDHIVRINKAAPAERTLWLKCYSEAAWCVCDSRILQRLGRLRGIELELATGSDLTERVFLEVLRPSDAILVIGGHAQMLERLGRLYPDIDIKQHIPPYGLRYNSKALDEAAHFVSTHPARFIFLAVGSPQQEMLALRILELGCAVGTGLCVGASIDFLTGEETRAPKLMQSAGLEWLHRLASNPRKMWRRYLVDGMGIIPIAAAWNAGRKKRMT